MVLTGTLILLSTCDKKDDDKIIDPDFNPPEAADVYEINSRLGRGVNLGNALEAPNEGEWGVTLQEEYFELIEQEGFNSIRIPIRWSTHAANNQPHMIDPPFLERVKWAVDQTLSRDMLAVINMHHYEEMMTEPYVHKERFLGIWKQIADTFKNYPIELLFEILNEPTNALVDTLWNSYLQEAIDVIRETNPTRILIIGPPDWNSIGGLSKLKLPEDDRDIIVTVHYYNPFQFTHQGAEWVNGSDAWLGTRWTGTQSQKQAMINDFAPVLNWSLANNRPIFVGEFGAYSKADLNSRVAWTTFLARHLESIGLSWAYWEFCSGFGIYDSSKNQWNAPLLRALIP
ncbi:glycoside hydrolase family 5 protein [candidate division KSB1 bacterium]|nr:glycoside hydrolase family 5 protein [candidate division KSB1 bacterium]